MAEDKKSTDGFRAGFLGDMLRDLQEEIGIENKKPRGKRRRDRASKRPAGKQKKDDGLTAMPAVHMDRLTEAESASREQSEQRESGAEDFLQGEKLLGTYRIESEAFKGGMGAVWKVHHEGWDTDLAMKRPRPEAFRTDKQKEDFMHECDCWIKLGLHPNIVSCYYVREIYGVPTIFSEWMENGDLGSHIKRGTLYAGTEEEVQERLLDVAIQFARGLHYAHESKLVHQDVKPDNLLLSKDWQAKVSDFGISRAR